MADNDTNLDNLNGESTERVNILNRQTTNNIKLIKPRPTDWYDVSDMNTNSNVIDEVIGKILKALGIRVTTDSEGNPVFPDDSEITDVDYKIDEAITELKEWLVTAGDPNILDTVKDLIDWLGANAPIGSAQKSIIEQLGAWTVSYPDKSIAEIANRLSAITDIDRMISDLNDSLANSDNISPIQYIKFSELYKEDALGSMSYVTNWNSEDEDFYPTNEGWTNTLYAYCDKFVNEAVEFVSNSDTEIIEMDLNGSRQNIKNAGGSFYGSNIDNMKIGHYYEIQTTCVMQSASEGYKLYTLITETYPLAQIIGIIDDKFDGVRNNIDDITSSVNSIDNAVNDLDSAVSGLSNDVDTNSTSIRGIDNTLALIEGSDITKITNGYTIGLSIDEAFVDGIYYTENDIIANSYQLSGPSGYSGYTLFDSNYNETTLNLNTIYRFKMLFKSFVKGTAPGQPLFDWGSVNNSYSEFTTLHPITSSDADISQWEDGNGYSGWGFIIVEPANLNSLSESIIDTKQDVKNKIEDMNGNIKEISDDIDDKINDLCILNYNPNHDISEVGKLIISDWKVDTSANIKMPDDSIITIDTTECSYLENDVKYYIAMKNNRELIMTRDPEAYNVISILSPIHITYDGDMVMLENGSFSSMTTMAAVTIDLNTTQTGFLYGLTYDVHDILKYNINYISDLKVETEDNMYITHVYITKVVDGIKISYDYDLPANTTQDRQVDNDSNIDISISYNSTYSRWDIDSNVPVAVCKIVDQHETSQHYHINASISENDDDRLIHAIARFVESYMEAELL